MILIIGCGFLGQYILKELLEHTDEPIVATYRENKNEVVFDEKRITWLQFDVTKEADISALKRICGEETLTVFYLASCHNIDFVFRNPQVAYQVNVSAVEAFLKEFPNVKTLIYASTDCVYGEGAGRDGGFQETDATNPINVYGHQKAEAEQRVLQSGFHVARLPYMLGPSLSEKKTFYDRIVADLKHARPVQMVDGLERSVLSYRQVARILVRLAFEKEVPRIMNIAGDKAYTKYEMGCCIATRNGFENTQITKMLPQDAEALFADRRAETTVMDNRLLKRILKIDHLEWECPG